MAQLTFDTFAARVAVKVLSDASAEVRVELISALPGEPVVYSFFPAAALDKEPVVSDDGRTLRLGKVTLTCSRAPEIERGFRIVDPYSAESARTVDTAPVRAHVALDRAGPFVIRIDVSSARGRGGDRAPSRGGPRGMAHPPALVAAPPYGAASSQAGLPARSMSRHALAFPSSTRTLFRPAAQACRS